MNLQRLKFAWARGARVQVPVYEGWSTDTVIGWDTVDNEFAVDELSHPEVRIHPDDEHLAYGPVSTAYRDMALFTDYADTLGETVDLFLDMAGCNWVLEGVPSNNIESDFCRLMFAEYLADEGL